MQAPITSSKVDIMFANSLNSAKNSLIVQICLHLLQFLTMATMIPLQLKIFNTQGQEVLSFFIIASCITFINLSAKFSHLFCTLRDDQVCLSIATQLNHIIDQQQQSQRLGENNKLLMNQLVVSDRIYNVQTGMANQQALPEIRRSYQPALANMIRTIALSRDPLARCSINIGAFISFGLFIYGIIVMSTVSHMNPAEITVMILFLISEFIIQIQLFLCLIFIALLPLLCFLFCIFVCFCRQGHKQAKLPQTVPASVDIIQKAEGSPCSICYQDILLNENVVVLPCSQKHVFHDNCLRAWTSVKPTCPVCRFDLSS